MLLIIRMSTWEAKIMLQGVRYKANKNTQGLKIERNEIKGKKKKRACSQSPPSPYAL
jgi:hypothetical protein